MAVCHNELVRLRILLDAFSHCTLKFDRTVPPRLVRVAAAPFHNFKPHIITVERLQLSVQPLAEYGTPFGPPGATRERSVDEEDDERSVCHETELTVNTSSDYRNIVRRKKY